METTGHAWKAMVRNLYHAFQKADEERELLGMIDRSIIDAREAGARSVEAVFADSLRELSRIHALRESGSCYVYVGPQLLVLDQGEGGTRSQPSRLDTSDVIRGFVAEVHDGNELLARDDTSDGLFEQFADANTLLLQPIYLHAGELLCVLLFADVARPEGSRLVDPDFRASLRAVSQQIRIAYEHGLKVNQESRTEELWDLFLSSHLAPTRCFHDLAHQVRNAFPTFGPLRLTVKPEVQILVVPDTDDPQFLTIRGTTGDEAAITKIDVSDSISGLLLEDVDLAFFYDDPRKPDYAGRYKSYLGLERQQPIRTEFAVRLCMPHGRLVGVLNIESEAVDAFNLHHRNAILAFASRIAPMVDVFEQRIAHNRIMHRSVISTTSIYLESLARIFRHGIGTPLLALNLDLGAVRQITQRSVRDELQPVLDEQEGTAAADHLAALAEQLEQVDTVLVRLLTTEKQIGGFAENFAEDISGFSEIGRFDIRRLIDETVDLARRSMLATEESIKIIVRGTERADAFCSLLLKQHVYSLLTNAIYSLQAQARTPASPGVITVTIEPDATPDATQEVDLNKRWAIRVRDNGGGVEAWQLDELRRFQAETRFRDAPGEAPGQGLGLLGVQRYVGSIGGWITLDSKLDEFFEVTLLLDEYREDIHGPYSTIGQGTTRAERRD